VIVWVSLYEPLTKRNEFDWRIIFIKSKTFATDCVILSDVSLLVVACEQVIGITIWVGV
jgi:hypothetical protein